MSVIVEMAKKPIKIGTGRFDNWAKQKQILNEIDSLTFIHNQHITSLSLYLSLFDGADGADGTDGTDQEVKLQIIDEKRNFETKLEELKNKLKGIN